MSVAQPDRGGVLCQHCRQPILLVTPPGPTDQWVHVLTFEAACGVVEVRG